MAKSKATATGSEIVKQIVKQRRARRTDPTAELFPAFTAGVERAKRVRAIPRKLAHWPPPNDDLIARLSDLQDKELLRGLTTAEKAELKTLLARLRLEDREELEAVAKSEVVIKRYFGSLISEIRAITRELRKQTGTNFDGDNRPALVSVGQPQE